MINPNIYIEIQRPYTVVVMDGDKTYTHTYDRKSKAEPKAIELAKNSGVFCYFDHFKNSMIYL